MTQGVHSLLARLAMLVAVSVSWPLAGPTAPATVQTPSVAVAPVAYVALEEEQRGPISFMVVTKDGTEVARSGPQPLGVLLPPGDYILRADRYAVPVSIPAAAQFPQGVDFLAPLRQPRRLAERYVNADNGDFWLPVADGRLTRWYNSRSLYNGPFGFGWTFDYGTRLARTPKGHFEVLEADGYMTSYHPYATGLHTSLSNARYPSMLIEDAGRVMRRIEGAGYLDTFGRYVTGEVFDTQGRLRTVRYATGEVHEVRYEGDALRAVVNQETGETLYAFESDASGHIVTMVDPLARRYRYSYEGDRLTSVTAPDGATTRYRYDDELNLIGITYPDGAQASLTYIKEKDWLIRMQAPHMDYRYEYGESSPDHLWTLRTEQGGNVVRWDFYSATGTTLVTSIERLDAKLSRLLANMGLGEEKPRLELESFAPLVDLGLSVEAARLREPGLEAIGMALRLAKDLPRSRVKRALTVLDLVRRNLSELTPHACMVLTEARDRFFAEAAPPPSVIVHLDAAGQVVTCYPFSGHVAAGSLTWMDNGHVVVGDLEPWHYQLLDPSSGQLRPADEAASEAALEAIAELPPKGERRAADYQLLFRLLARPVFLALRLEADQPTGGFTVHLGDFGTGVPDLGVLAPETVVLAAREAGFPVLSMALADGAVRRLGEGPVLALTKFGSDVWGLYPERAVQYRRGREPGLVVPLPGGFGTPQGFTPLGDGTFLVSYLQEQGSGQPSQHGGTVAGKWTPWVGCAEEKAREAPPNGPKGKAD